MTQMFDKFIEEREDPVKAQAVNEGVCVCVSICTLSMCPFVLYQCVHLYFIYVSICTLSMCPFGIVPGLFEMKLPELKERTQEIEM